MMRKFIRGVPSVRVSVALKQQYPALQFFPFEHDIFPRCLVGFLIPSFPTPSFALILVCVADDGGAGFVFFFCWRAWDWHGHTVLATPVFFVAGIEY